MECDRRTVLSKAHNYEAAMILTKYGAETNRKEDDLNRMVKWHTIPSPRAILSQCISKVSEDLLVLDLGHFYHTKLYTNEMYWHLLVQDHGKSELLLHPIFQVFLDLKWNQVKKFYWFHLFLEILFAILLTCSAFHFLELIYCQPCDEIIDRSWSMEINSNNTRGIIHCFSPFSHCYEDEVPNNCEKKEGSCSTIIETCPDQEKCARFTEDSTNTTIESYDAWKNISIKCHKNFLR